MVKKRLDEVVRKRVDCYCKARRLRRQRKWWA